MTMSPYPDPEARDAELAAVCARVGAELVPFGASVEGRTLAAARIARPGAPRVVVGATIHGVEWIANRVAVGFLRSLPGSALAERAEIWVIPCINPDGYARTWAQRGEGRVGELRTNARGVDLNRNFPLPWGARPSRIPFAGSSRRGTATWRGEAPLSEPETRSLVALLGRIDAHAGANLHAFMGTVIPPRVLHAEDRAVYARLAAAFAKGQRHARYPRLASRLDVFTGEQEDWQHHAMGTWAVCVETFPVLASVRQHIRAPSTFWRFNPREPDPWVLSDVAGLHALLGAALEVPRVPRRPGAWTALSAWGG